MIAVADDFLAETEALAVTIAQSGLAFDAATLFKGWTVTAVVRHLHFWNEAARLSLQDPDSFTALLNDVMPLMMQAGIRATEDQRLADLEGQALIDAWLETARNTALAFREADPELRLAWAGPPMSAESSITARLMETWAHAQAVYDAAGLERQDSDRIKAIAELGVRTFGWTYKVRGRDKPESKPFVRLTAPSGDTWTWNDERQDEVIEGSATEFCQVVTQTRNIADTDLRVTGPIATEWMGMAQCFAGAAEDPPAPGTRRRAA
ncbi:MAG: TIGR03084 family metal-binding protein [Pseudomonadota bacterium]